MAIRWTDDLITGEKTIDDQHRLLFEAVGDLMDAMWEGKGSQEVGNLLKLLSGYVEKHFLDEEVFMRTRHYPDYEPHKRVHDAFSEEIADFRKRFASGEMNSDLVVEVLDKSCDWLRNHISKVDQDMVRHLKGK
ncbi:MAG: bacteriohemerythrin [Thermodesulfobacteriota bacterium]